MGYLMMGMWRLVKVNRKRKNCYRDGGTRTEVDRLWAYPRSKRSGTREPRWWDPRAVSEQFGENTEKVFVVVGGGLYVGADCGEGFGASEAVEGP